LPELKLASDQSYREADLAIDFREDIPDQGLEVARRIKDVFTSYKAQARISSIHVNCWFGDYDKLSTTKLFFDHVLGLDFDKNSNKFMFFGDSPNDSPMFSAVNLSCGVGNIEKYGNLMTSRPQFVSKSEDGSGVLDVVNHILKLREG
jgi:hydroxymethylpyrimidine pyrophosphatase-like HAD family hydrolase